jgi:iron-sulfur cluster assembly accessory protein
MTVATMEETVAVTLTESAADKLIGIMNDKGVAETHGLRVFVSGSGCSGLQYGMTFDANTAPADLVMEQHGLRVIIDPQSLRYMTGASIDYVDDPSGGGFHIDNPNAAATCSSGGCSGCR